MVQAFKVQYLNGRRILAPWDAMKVQYLPLVDFGSLGPPVELPPQTKTNAAGEYRLFGLPPGEYYLSMWSTGPNPCIDEPPVYYPGVSDPSIAIPVIVRGGSPEAIGMDIQIPEIRGYTTYWVLAPDGIDINAFDNPEFFKVPEPGNQSCSGECLSRRGESSRDCQVSINSYNPRHHDPHQGHKTRFV
jgi:hypothetical protein